MPITLSATPTSGGTFVGPASSGYLHLTGPVTNLVTGFVSSRSGHVRFSGGGDYTSLGQNAGTVSLGGNNGLSPSATLAMALTTPGGFRV